MCIYMCAYIYIYADMYNVDDSSSCTQTFVCPVAAPGSQPPQLPALGHVSP